MAANHFTASGIVTSYHARLSKLNEKAGQLMQEYVAAHGAEDGPALIAYAHALVTKYGEGSAELACQMYDALAEASKANLPAAEPAATAEYGEVARMVNATKRQNPANLPNGVRRLVKRAGADTTLHNAIRDGAEWAWVPHGDTCPFCIMLASNGWQKASAKLLKGGHAEHIHANCDCEFAVRFDGSTNVAGYDPEKYLRQYRAAGSDVNAMRRIDYAAHRERINAQKRAAYAARTAYTNQAASAILDTSNKIGVNPDVNYICDLNPEIYKVAVSTITTRHVIITDKQLEHIRERHPDISATVMEQLTEIIHAPDYIIETDMPYTANILKHLEINGKGYQLVLRIRTDADPEDFQNSVITFMSVNEKRYRQYLRNRKILYKRE